MITFGVALVLLFAIALLYFKIANKYNIVDKPNQRSSHTKVTIRGGGVIFPLAFIAGTLLFQPQNGYLALAVLAISSISFIDDVLTLSNKIRISVHTLAVGLAVYQCVNNQPYLQDFIGNSSIIFLVGCAVVTFVLFIGIINACNFMDGINGISVLYFTVVLGSVCFVQSKLGVFLFTNGVWQIFFASLVVFGFFNVRTKAKTFAGDVGSIALALILCFLVLSLMVNTQQIKWILLLSIYGLDTICTILCRLCRGENIFEAHRSHFYQYLANKRKIGHITISVAYALLQLLVNYFLLYNTSGLYAFIIFALIVVAYCCLRLYFEGKNALFNRYPY
ncbi:MAG: glycosyl transferase family 4 [Sphingobacteriales bacterium]|nr:MAG: glycosyl transferase family 4 [Sphingobacteriales bacterium]TAF81456.1 MAG: glycosyl transferase family 4 [Sphingobacteriales bacterium]